MNIDELGYVGLDARDLDAWETLVAQILGGDVTRRDDGAIRVRLDGHAQRLVVRQADHDGLGYMGFATAGEAELDEQVEALVRAGFSVTPGTADEVADRSVERMAWLRDPSGFRVELFHGPGEAQTPFSAGRPMAGFVTGDQGIGHVVLMTPAYDDSVRFYMEQLGFRVSDHIDLGGGVDSTFLHCNGRHHTLALLRQPDPETAAFLHHVMFEVRSLDDVGVAYDLCLDRRVPVAMGVGRHTNDHMTSFYLETPSKFLIEYGHGGRVVDDETWEVQHYTSPSIWGHRPPAANLPA